MTKQPITNISNLQSADPFKEACGAIKDGKIIHAWKTWPDAWDCVDKDFDYIRPLSEAEVKEWMGV